MIKRVVKIGLIAVVTLSLTGIGLAAEPTSVGNEVTGEINAISKSLNFIAVVYKRDKANGVNYEVALPLTGSINLINVRSLKDLKAGDTVTVEYSDITDFDAANHEVHKRVVTAIKFIRPASAPVNEAPEEPASGSALSS
jgi:hypothetical protein